MDLDGQRILEGIVSYDETAVTHKIHDAVTGKLLINDIRKDQRFARIRDARDFFRMRASTYAEGEGKCKCSKDCIRELRELKKLLEDYETQDFNGKSQDLTNKITELTEYETLIYSQGNLLEVEVENNEVEINIQIETLISHYDYLHQVHLETVSKVDFFIMKDNC